MSFFIAKRKEIISISYCTSQNHISFKTQIKLSVLFSVVAKLMFNLIGRHHVGIMTFDHMEIMTNFHKLSCFTI